MKISPVNRESLFSFDDLVTGVVPVVAVGRLVALRDVARVGRLVCRAKIDRFHLDLYLRVSLRKKKKLKQLIK